MKITVSGNIAKARAIGVDKVNEKAGIAVSLQVPDGLGFLYHERRQQAKRGGGKMVDTHAELHGLTHKQALDAINAESDRYFERLDQIENARQSAIVAINQATRVADIDTIIEGMRFDG